MTRLTASDGHELDADIPLDQVHARSAAIALGRTLEFLADNGVV